jgi:hypothetical protein
VEEEEARGGDVKWRIKIHIPIDGLGDENGDPFFWPKYKGRKRRDWA